MRLEPEEIEAIAAALAPRVAAIVLAELASGQSARVADAEGDLVSVRRAAELVGVSAATVRRAYRSGRLPATRPDGANRIVVRVQDLREWAAGEERRVAAPARRAPRPRPADLTPRRPRVRAATSTRSSSPHEPGSAESLREIERASERPR